MEIIPVTTPAFEYEGKSFYVDTRMYPDLCDFQNVISNYEKEGVTKCFFYSLHTQYEPDFPEHLQTLYTIRCKFIK